MVAPPATEAFRLCSSAERLPSHPRPVLKRNHLPGEETVRRVVGTERRGCPRLRKRKSKGKKRKGGNFIPLEPFRLGRGGGPALKARTWRETAGAFQGNSAFHVRYPVKACGGVASPDAGRSIPDGVGASHAEVHLGVRPHCRLSGGAGSSLSLTEAASSLSLNPQPLPLPPHSAQYQLLHLCSVEAVRTEVLGERLPLLL